MGGNRTGEVYSGNTTAPLSMPVNWVNYDGNNRMTNSSQVMGGYTYDAAGDTTFDGANAYTYDGEGRVSTACAGQMCTKYVYDAEGRRVAKGSYDPQSGAFAPSEQYILGLGGEEVTALNGSGQWLRTNAYLGGALLATYKDAALYFQFTDWLGTKRVQLANDGTQPETCRSLPYGNQLDCSGGPEVDPHHFTGKQRDAETGLDYFGARYFSSPMGRWMSPDWAANATAVPYADFGSPQSLNLYSYVGNNPLSHADLDGHCWPASDCADKIDAGIDRAYNAVVNSAIQDRAEGGAEQDLVNTTFYAGAFADMAKGATNLLRLGSDIGNTASDIRSGDYLKASNDVAQDGARTVAIVALTDVALKSVPTSSDVPTSIPAGPSARPTAAQQGAINEMGEAHGCSTCGAKSPGTKSGNWVGDHQPPTALNQKGASQVYKPQCLQCSRIQGGQVAAQVRAAAAAAKKKPDGQ